MFFYVFLCFFKVFESASEICENKSNNIVKISNCFNYYEEYPSKIYLEYNNKYINIICFFLAIVIIGLYYYYDFDLNIETLKIQKYICKKSLGSSGKSLLCKLRLCAHINKS